MLPSEIAQSGFPIPGLHHQNLLKAALLNGADMQKAYSLWRDNVDFENEVESASIRLLPLLYNNISKAPFGDEIFARLKGIYRKRWSEGNIFFYKIKPVLQLLSSKEIKLIVLKGVPLAIQYYKNIALRPMADIDLLVLKEQRELAIHALVEDGFTIKEQAPLAFLLRTFRSVTLVKDHLEIDLHWSPLLESFGIQSERLFWEEAVPIEVMGVKVAAFCPTDQLFHTLVHGFRYNPEPPIRWIADAVTILRSEAHLDWSRLWSLTERHKVNLQVKHALLYLEKEFQIEIPKGIVRLLHNYKGKRAERILYKNALNTGWQFEHPETFSQTVSMHYFIHLRQSTQKSFFMQNLSFVRYTSYLIKSTPAYFFKRTFNLFFKMFKPKSLD